MKIKAKKTNSVSENAFESSSSSFVLKFRRLIHLLGPFIRGKIRRELYHLYEHVLSNKTA